MSDLISQNVQFHNKLNPKIWHGMELDSEVRMYLLDIAKTFINSLEIEDLPLVDVHLTGSMASYNYTPFSDFDLHVVINRSKMKGDPALLDKMFQSVKTVWNEHYPIKIHGHDVEVYAEDTAKPPHSNGTFDLIDNKWIEKPKKIHALINDRALRVKSLDLMHSIDHVIEHSELARAKKLKEKIVKMRKDGLEKTGQYGVENLAFKILRNQGYMDKLFDFIKYETTKELSLKQ